MEETLKLELREISKSFPGVQALDRVSIGVKKGHVHAIIGENGAGKSTMMKIINGLYRPDTGEIFIDGEKVVIKDPKDAQNKGISMIFQELNFFPELSIEENLFMGNFPSRRIGCFVNWKEIRRKMKKLAAEEGINYDPEMKIKELTVSQIQMLEILKAVTLHKASIIIMDEPTSSIGSKEVSNLFRKIRQLKEQGISILYISHKLEEILQIADDISVIRDGRYITGGSVKEFNEEKLITAMVGRKLEQIYPKEEAVIGEEMLRISGLGKEGVFKNVQLHVKNGEIVGLAGLVGAGRTELARAIAGLDSIDTGEIWLNGKKIHLKNIGSAIRQGIIMVSEDRKRYGIIPIRSILENISLTLLKMEKGSFIHKKVEREKALSIAKELNVKAPGLETLVGSLSGGNQQKVVLAKWLLLKSKVIILDEPTRGIDIGAKAEIYKIITRLAKRGVAIIMISSELPELIGMSDRIYVMSHGQITGEIERKDFSQELIMKKALEVGYE